MDISKIINNEQLYKLELLHPITEKPLGIIFTIRSTESEAAREVQRIILDTIYERNRTGKKLKSEHLIENDLDKAAACIVDWDFGENKFNGEIPQFDKAKAKEILKQEGWILAQVAEAANNLVNFTRN